MAKIIKVNNELILTGSLFGDSEAIRFELDPRYNGALQVDPIINGKYLAIAEGSAVIRIIRNSDDKVIRRMSFVIRGTDAPIDNGNENPTLEYSINGEEVIFSWNYIDYSSFAEKLRVKIYDSNNTVSFEENYSLSGSITKTIPQFQGESIEWSISIIGQYDPEPSATQVESEGLASVIISEMPTVTSPYLYGSEAFNYSSVMLNWGNLDTTTFIEGNEPFTIVISQNGEFVKSVDISETSVEIEIPKLSGQSIQWNIASGYFYYNEETEKVEIISGPTQASTTAKVTDAPNPEDFTFTIERSYANWLWASWNAIDLVTQINGNYPDSVQIVNQSTLEESQFDLATTGGDYISDSTSLPGTIFTIHAAWYDQAAGANVLGPSQGQAQI